MKRKLSFNHTDSSVVVSENEHRESELDFDPTHFLRCHSKIKTDAADVSTQIWQCSFEPDPNDPTKTTDLVATCGGDSVCFIDVRLGKVLRKYYSNSKSESFFALAWTTCENYNHNDNLLAVGGALCSIHFIDPAKNTMFLEHKLNKSQRKGKDHISSLLFHKKESNILFCSMSVGRIFIFDIGNPLVANYKNQITLLHTLKTKSSELFTTTLSPDLNVLLAATDDCLRGWKIPALDQLKNTETRELTFSFPSSRAASESNTTLVDSVEAVGGSTVATKCVLHSCIYLWDVGAELRAGGREATRFTVTPLRTLRWSDTDNYYMGMGYDTGSGLLACGDDKGALWVYDLRAKTEKQQQQQPAAILAWPEVVDEHIASRRKLKLDTYDIVVDSVAVGNGGRYLVAVTANNMVCVWRRAE